VANVAVEAEVNLEAEAEADANLKAGNRETPRGGMSINGGSPTAGWFLMQNPK